MKVLFLNQIYISEYYTKNQNNLFRLPDCVLENLMMTLKNIHMQYLNYDWTRMWAEEDEILK